MAHMATVERKLLVNGAVQTHLFDVEIDLSKLPHSFFKKALVQSGGKKMTAHGAIVIKRRK